MAVEGLYQHLPISGTTTAGIPGMRRLGAHRAGQISAECRAGRTSYTGPPRNSASERGRLFDAAC